MLASCGDGEKAAEERIDEANAHYDAAQVYEKKGSHRALGDIVESVEELRFYKKLFMPD